MRSKHNQQTTMIPFQKAMLKHPSLDRSKEEALHQLSEEEEGSTMLTAPVVGETKRSLNSIKRKKMVTFDRSVAVRTHLHLNDITTSEFNASWYKEEELAIIRAQCCKVIRKINNMEERNQSKSQKEDTPNGEETILSCRCRGLEHRTKAGSQLRFEHRLTAWEMVELEQNRQWDEGTCNEEKIAEVYHACTDESARVAYLLALKDQQWVQDHNNDACMPPNLETKKYCKFLKRGSKWRSSSSTSCAGGCISAKPTRGRSTSRRRSLSAHSIQK